MRSAEKLRLCVAVVKDGAANAGEEQKGANFLAAGGAVEDVVGSAGMQRGGR